MDIQKVAASVFKGFFCKFLKASFSILLVLWLLYRFGMVDAEMGARLVQSGISVYLTPPSADRKFGLIEFVCFSFITLILFCSNLKRSFKSNFQTMLRKSCNYSLFLPRSFQSMRFLSTQVPKTKAKVFSSPQQGNLLVS